MVTVLLRGGLGNQMFQYAAGLGIAKRNNDPLLIDSTYLNDRFPRKQFTFREYDLDIFDITPKFTTLSKLSTAMSVPGLWLGLDLGLLKIKNSFGIQKILKEKQELVFDRNLVDARGNILIWGYWQTPGYFADIEEELRKEFRFKHALEGDALNLSKDIRESNSVSLHVRRTDYLIPKNTSLYGETNSSYYDKAIAYIDEHVKNPKFFIFSDDIAWCRENIKPPFPTTYIDRASEGPKASYHLQLMSMCKHNVITNSSFSWWGAWLNENPGKIVVAPARWSPSSQGNEDVVPDGWTRL